MALSSFFSSFFLFLLVVFFFISYIKRVCVWCVLFNLFEWLLFCSYCTRFYFEFERKNSERRWHKTKNVAGSRRKKKLNKNSENIVVSLICVVVLLSHKFNWLVAFLSQVTPLKTAIYEETIYDDKLALFFPVVIAAAVVVLKGSSRSKTLALLWLCVCVCVAGVAKYSIEVTQTICKIRSAKIRNYSDLRRCNVIRYSIDLYTFPVACILILPVPYGTRCGPCIRASPRKASECPPANFIEFLPKKSGQCGRCIHGQLATLVCACVHCTCVGKRARS